MWSCTTSRTQDANVYAVVHLWTPYSPSQHQRNEIPPGVFRSPLSSRLTDKSHTRVAQLSRLQAQLTAVCSTLLPTRLRSKVPPLTQLNMSHLLARITPIIKVADRRSLRLPDELFYLCCASSCPPQQRMFTPNVIHATVCFPVFCARSSRDIICPSL